MPKKPINNSAIPENDVFDSELDNELDLETSQEVSAEEDEDGLIKDTLLEDEEDLFPAPAKDPEAEAL